MRLGDRLASLREKAAKSVRQGIGKRSLILLALSALLVTVAHVFSLGGWRVVVPYVLRPYPLATLFTWLAFSILFLICTFFAGGRTERGVFLGISLVLILYINAFDLPRLLTARSLLLDLGFVGAAFAVAVLPWGRRIYWLLSGVLIAYTFLTYPKDTIRTSGLYSDRIELGASRKEAPNLLVICVDTLRADHLGCYGYQRNISPNLDRSAGEGTIFLDCTSQGGWTHPSTASYLTSRHASEAGVRHLRDSLSFEYPTMADWWREHGYETYAVLANPLLAPDFGKCRGFQRVVFDSAMTARLRYLFPFYLAWRGFGAFGHNILAEQDSKNADQVVHFFEEWYESGPPEPWLAYLHFMDPHDPYLPPEPFTGKWGTDKANQYDAEIEYWDTWFGELKDYLGQAWDRTVIVVLSDHGEHLGEDGLWGHTCSLYQELLHVPFVFRFPGNVPAERREEPVGLIDLLPTLAGLSGVPANPDWLGRDLFAENTPNQNEKDPTPTYFSESFPFEPDPQNTWTGLRRGSTKIVHGENRNGTFDLEKDPAEDVDIGTIEDLDRVLRQHAGAMDEAYTSTPFEPSDALTRQLRALGYIK